MTKAETRRIIDSCYTTIALALGGGRASEHFAKARDASEQGEREHRALGSRFTREQARYKLSKDYAARYFVAKWFLDDHAAPASWVDCVEVRQDVMYALAARDAFRAGERMPQGKTRGGEAAYLDLREKCSALASIDYAKDIADNAA